MESNFGEQKSSIEYEDSRSDVCVCGHHILNHNVVNLVLKECQSKHCGCNKFCSRRDTWK